MSLIKSRLTNQQIDTTTDAFHYACHLFSEDLQKIVMIDDKKIDGQMPDWFRARFETWLNKPGSSLTKRTLNSAKQKITNFVNKYQDQPLNDLTMLNTITNTINTIFVKPSRRKSCTIVNNGFVWERISDKFAEDIQPLIMKAKRQQHKI